MNGRSPKRVEIQAERCVALLGMSVVPSQTTARVFHDFQHLVGRREAPYVFSMFVDFVLDGVLES